MITTFPVTHVRLTPLDYNSYIRVDAIIADDFSCCGDGALDDDYSPSEFCDDGNNASLDGCSETCTEEYPRCAETVAMCIWSASEDGTECTEDGDCAICGDGFLM